MGIGLFQKNFKQGWGGGGWRITFLNLPPKIYQPLPSCPHPKIFRFVTKFQWKQALFHSRKPCKIVWHMYLLKISSKKPRPTEIPLVFFAIDTLPHVYQFSISICWLCTDIDIPILKYLARYTGFSSIFE